MRRCIGGKSWGVIGSSGKRFKVYPQNIVICPRSLDLAAMSPVEAADD